MPAGRERLETYLPGAIGTSRPVELERQEKQGTRETDQHCIDRWVA